MKHAKDVQNSSLGCGIMNCNVKMRAKMTYFRKVANVSCQTFGIPLLSPSTRQTNTQKIIQIVALSFDYELKNQKSFR